MRIRPSGDDPNQVEVVDAAPEDMKHDRVTEMPVWTWNVGVGRDFGEPKP